MKKLDIFSSIFWFILSISISTHSLKLGLGSIYNPGPGFLYFWCGIILGILSIIVLILALVTKEDKIEGQEKVFKNINWVRIISILLSLMVYAIIIERLGFLISTILLIAFLLHSIEAKRWYIIVFLAFTSTFLTYILFELLLKIRLPKGIL